MQKLNKHNLQQPQIGEPSENMFFRVLLKLWAEHLRESCTTDRISNVTVCVWNLSSLKLVSITFLQALVAVRFVWNKSFCACDQRLRSCWMWAFMRWRKASPVDPTHAPLGLGFGAVGGGLAGLELIEWTHTHTLLDELLSRGVGGGREMQQQCLSYYPLSPFTDSHRYETSSPLLVFFHTSFPS